MHAEAPQVIHGTVEVDRPVEVKASGSKSAEALVDLANEIWQEVRDSGVSVDDHAENDKYYARLRKKHADFAVSFPAVLRWMVQQRSFHAKPFKKYLTAHVKGFYKDRIEFLESQAAYLALLYRHEHPRKGAVSVAKYREAIMAGLIKEDEEFAKAREGADAGLKEHDAAVAADRRKRVYEHFARKAGQVKPAPPEA